jgi:predicted homoserine dehydrogenase-like protein
MIYEHFFQQTEDQIIRVGLIGTGTYGMSLFSQVQLIPRLEIPVLCDRNIEALRHACR